MVEFMTEFFYSLQQSPKKTLLNPHFFLISDQLKHFSFTFWTSGMKNTQKNCVRVGEHLCSGNMGNQDNETNSNGVFDSLYENT